MSDGESCLLESMDVHSGVSAVDILGKLLQDAGVWTEASDLSRERK